MCAGKGLTQLDVSQNQLQNAPSNAIKNLHHLLILNLNHNRISQIHNRAFEGLDTLEILTLYENKINVIEPEAFRGLEKWVARVIENFVRKSIPVFSSSFCFFLSENWNVSIWAGMNWHRCRSDHYPFLIISRNWKFRRIKSEASKKVISKVKHQSSFFSSLSFVLDSIGTVLKTVRYQEHCEFVFHLIFHYLSSSIHRVRFEKFGLADFGA